MLYKFISDSTACMSCSSGFLKFTPIPELNDPSEMFASIDPIEVERSLKRIRASGYDDDDILALRKQEARRLG